MNREKLRGTARSIYYGCATELSRRFQAHSDRRAVFFPSNQPWDPASNLRAWEIAPILRQRGWRVVVGAAGLSLSQRIRLLKAEHPQIVLLQQTRHPLNDPALYAPFPCVLDIDDADCLDPRHAERIAAACNSSAGVIVGNSFLREVLTPHARGPVTVIWTGSPRRLTPVPPRSNELRPPIVAWAHSVPLQYPLEAELVRKTLSLVARQTQFEFWLFGSTPESADAWLAPLRNLGVTCRTIPTLPFQKYLDCVAEAAIGLQPVCTENPFSRGKSFGKVLAYLEGQVAVVASDAVDHALFFRSGENGLLVPNEPERWAQAIYSLLVDQERRGKVATMGHQDYLAQLTIKRSGDLVSEFFDDVLNRPDAERMASPPGPPAP